MGNPILAIYAQMFLTRAFTLLDDISGSKTKLVFDEMLMVLNRLSRQKPRTYEKITFEEYLSLFKPAADWISLLLIRTNSDSFVFSVMQQLRAAVAETHSLVFLALLDQVSGHLVTQHSGHLVERCEVELETNHREV